MQAIRTANVLESRGMLNEAYALTVDVLAMAAVILLVVELGGLTCPTMETVRVTSRNAKTLLECLAQRNCAAAQCLESLMVSKAQDVQLQWSWYATLTFLRAMATDLCSLSTVASCNLRRPHLHQSKRPCPIQAY